MEKRELYIKWYLYAFWWERQLCIGYSSSRPPPPPSSPVACLELRGRGPDWILTLNFLETRLRDGAWLVVREVEPALHTAGGPTTKRKTLFVETTPDPMIAILAWVQDTMYPTVSPLADRQLTLVSWIQHDPGTSQPWWRQNCQILLAP